MCVHYLLHKHKLNANDLGLHTVEQTVDLIICML